MRQKKEFPVKNAINKLNETYGGDFDWYRYVKIVNIMWEGCNDEVDNIIREAMAKYGFVEVV